MPEKKDKYLQLIEDIKTAMKAGKETERQNPDDGGSCNFDSPVLILPRWNAKKVIDAAKEAGSSAFIWNMYGSRRFILEPDTEAQANARSRNAEAMTRELQKLGYDARMYYAAD